MELKIGFILVLVAFALFVIYNSIAIGIFGIPSSMSKTYYLYEEKHKGLGWLFTVFMWLMAFTMIPGWIIISEDKGPWESYLTVFAFVAGVAIVFVGTAPRYKQDLEGDVHMTAAKLCAATALIWDFVACWHIWWAPICGAVIPVIIGAATKSWKSGRDYWLEMMAFDATFATLITEAILRLYI